MNRIEKSSALPFVLPLLRCVLFILIGLAFAGLAKLSLEQASRWWSVICVVVNLITIAMLAWVFHAEGTTYREVIGSLRGDGALRSTLLITLLMVALGIGGMYGFAFLIYGFAPVTMIQPIPVWVAVINIVLLPLTVVFAEFPLYFGYALQRIDHLTRNKWLAIGYPMFWYALQHSFIPLLNDWRHILFRFLSYLPLMMALGIIYYRSRKLAPLMIGHAVLDLATTSQILMMSLSPALFESMKALTQ